MGAAIRRTIRQSRALAAALLVAVAAAAPLGAQQPVPVRTDPDQPIEINADSLEVRQDKQVAIFRGNVDAVQGRIRLNADELRVYYTNDDSSASDESAAFGGSVARIEAIGEVRIASPTETAQGERGIYDVAEQEITLTGDVVLTRGANVVRGDRLVLNVATGHSRVESGESGRVKGIFVPPEEKAGQEGTE